MLKEEDKDKESLEEKKDKEIDELKLKIKNLEAEIEFIRGENNKKVLDFVDKKSKEAAEIVRKKEEELINKYSSEFENKKKYIYEKQFAELTEIISQFETVINSINNPEVSNYLIGFQMFLSKFNDLLSSLNISLIDPKENEDFDSELMEAVSIKKVTQNNLDGKILTVFTKGYRLYNRVIKLATVEVGKLEG